MGSYSLYRHVSPSGKVYVGITHTKPEYRWNHGKGYHGDKQRLISNAIKKYGWDNISHEVIFTGLEPEQAKRLEIFFIAVYKSLGISYNLTDGGDGALGNKYRLGKKWSEEDRRKMSEQRKGRLTGAKNPMFGRRGILSPNYGKFGSKSPAAKMVYQYTKSGEFVREWNSIVDIHNEFGFTRTTISAACCGRIPSAFGFKWSHLPPSEYVPDSKNGYHDRGKSRTVYQYDMSGELIREWNSTMDVQRELGFSNSTISAACRGATKQAHGYKWSYKMERK